MSNLPVKRLKKKRRRTNPRREMTFLEHLGELRGRLVISVVAIVLTTAIGGGFLAKRTINLLTLPFGSIDIEKKSKVLEVRLAEDGTPVAVNQDELAEGWIKGGTLWITSANGKTTVTMGPRTRQTFIATKPFAPFFVWIKVAVIIGIVFALPIWMWQLWLFVAPAFTAAERRAVRPVLLAGIFLFPLGVLVAYGMLYIVMKFALGYAQRFMFIELWPDISNYLSFVIGFMMAFGFVFETPLVLVLLVRMRVISTQALKKSRPYAIVIMAVASALLTPQDPLSMIAMFIPMMILFETSLWVAKLVERKVEAVESELAKEP